MPDLGYAMQIAQKMREDENRNLQSAAEGLGQLGTTFDKYGFQKNATKHFVDKGVSPESIAELQQMYPTVDPQEAFKLAGATKAQKDAQTMKDVTISFMNYMKTIDPKDITPEKIQEFVQSKNLPDDQLPIFLEKVMPFALKTYKDTKGTLTGFDSTHNIYDSNNNLVTLGTPKAPVYKEKELYDSTGRQRKVYSLADEAKAIEEGFSSTKNAPEKTPKNLQAYTNPKGKTVLIDVSSPDAQAKIDREDLKPSAQVVGEERARAFSITPNMNTGTYFDKKDKKWKMNSDSGTIELTSAQQRNLGLTTKEETPTARTKTMQQLAPKVLERAYVARDLIESEMNKLGPIDSRTREIWAGNIGGKDPNYTRIRTTSDLLATLLANMHVGASGAEKTIERFSKMLEVKNQSPENLLANVDEIIKYAEEAKNPSIEKNNPMETPNIKNNQKGSRTIVEQRKTKDGRILTKYSDGSIE